MGIVVTKDFRIGVNHARFYTAYLLIMSIISCLRIRARNGITQFHGI